MKVEWNKKYTTIGVYAFLVIGASIIFFQILSGLGAFQTRLVSFVGTLMPIISGFSMAYLFNFILRFYEKSLLNVNFLNKRKYGLKRGFAVVLTYITVGFMVFLFLNFIFPQLVVSIVGLVNDDIPNYISHISKFINEFDSKYEIQEEYYNIIMNQWDKYKDLLIKFLTDLLPVVGNTIKSILSSIWNVFLGIIVSLYLLIDKEKFFAIGKKITYATFSEKRAERIIELTHRSNRIFGQFLAGKILDSFIIGVLTFIVLTIVKMPYTMLVSFIVGITNIIPFFGPFIGAIPSAILILFASPVKALWFLLIILIIQQIDGNIIGPKILGDSLGISPFWILFSILVSGKLFGLLGMIIGVPLFVFFYSIVKDIVEDSLKTKGLPYLTKDYKK